MGDFFRELLDKIHEWWPVRIIDAGCQGVLYRQDGTVRCLQPGTHFFVPKLQRIEEVNAQYQNTDCGVQSLTSRDGKDVQISLNIGYRIADAAQLYATFQHFDTSLVNMARGHAAEIVTQTEWSEILEDPQSLQQEIHEALQEDLGDGVIEVVDVTADQLARARTYRLLQSTSTE